MITEQFIKREVTHIWQSMFPEPYSSLFDHSQGLIIRIGNNTIKIRKKDLKMSLDDFSERIIMPLISQYVSEHILKK